MPCQRFDQSGNSLSGLVVQDRNQNLEGTYNIRTEFGEGSECSEETFDSEMSDWDSYSNGYPFSDEESDEYQRQIDDYIQKSIDEQLQKQFEEQLLKERRSLERNLNDMIDRSLQDDMMRISLKMREDDNNDFYFASNSCSDPISRRVIFTNGTVTNRSDESTLRSSGEEKVTIQEVDQMIQAVIDRYKDKN